MQKLYLLAPSYWFLNIKVPSFLLKPCSNGVRKTWFKFLGASPSKCWPNSMRVLVCIAKGKSVFFFKFPKWPMTPTFLSISLCSSTCSCGGVKKIGLLCSKYLTSLVPCLDKQAGLDLVSASWKDLDPHTLVSGGLRHFCMTVRCAAHCAGTTLRCLRRWK